MEFIGWFKKVSSSQRFEGRAVQCNKVKNLISEFEAIGSVGNIRRPGRLSTEDKNVEQQKRNYLKYC